VTSIDQGVTKRGYRVYIASQWKKELLGRRVGEEISFKALKRGGEHMRNP